MNADARRRRNAAKKNPYRNALPAPLRRPAGCLTRCTECLTRCLNEEDHDHDHTFACDHN